MNRKERIKQQLQTGVKLYCRANIFSQMITNWVRGTAGKGQAGIRRSRELCCPPHCQPHTSSLICALPQLCTPASRARLIFHKSSSASEQMGVKISHQWAPGIQQPQLGWDGMGSMGWNRMGWDCIPPETETALLVLVPFQSWWSNNLS